MLSRRQFVGRGSAALLLGLLGPRVRAGGLNQHAVHGAPGWGSGRPIVPISRHLTEIQMIEGYPFARRWSGDWPDLASGAHPPPFGMIDDPPPPSESMDIVVIGGGLSGLAAAYMLRDFAPVVLEHQGRFGGQAQGEMWNDVPYSLASAYFIAPDKGSSLETLYLELGFDKAARIEVGGSIAELNSGIIEDYFSAMDLPPEVGPAFEAYRNLVNFYVEQYPEIPLPVGGGKDNQWIIDLDRLSLKQHIEQALGGPAPDLLAAGVQSYCYSSFGAGWEEISAASGWNFLAAEEYGLWVLPGGNAGLVDTLWQRLSEEGARRGRDLLRHGCTVLDVRLEKSGAALVTYSDPAGALRSIRAAKVVFACPKYVVKQIMRDIGTYDAAKRDAIDRLDYRAYVVANVLLEAPVARDFYDIFLLGEGIYPHDTFSAEKFSRVTDVLAGHYALGGGKSPPPQSVLTLYWPLPWDTARFTLVPPQNPLETYGASLAPRLDAILKLLDVPRRAVSQVRLSRWGHAMPIAAPGLIADGHTEALRRPIGETFFFIEQDNWALPAVETCLLEAETYAAEIRALLRR